ncbi:MAG: GntR family transcriptional regulator [Elainellaceae cyanobacterium]
MVPSGQSADPPLHITISEKLRAEIEAGRYEAGERLPSEFDLGETFGVSRTTIRRAIANLTQQGFVTTQRGKGIFVSGRQKISFSMSNPLMQFDVALKNQGYVGRVQSLRFQRIEASPDLQRKLALPDSNVQVYWQEKIIYAGDSPIALEVDYFPEQLGEALAQQLQQGFTYSTLTKNGIALSASKVTLEAVPATYTLSEYLAVPLGMPLLVFSYVAYGRDESGSAQSESLVRKPVVCGRTLSRSDWTRYASECEL